MIEVLACAQKGTSWFRKYSIRLKSPNQDELDWKVRERTTASLTLIELFSGTVFPYRLNVGC